MPQERSKHQDKIIKNYYENRDAIALQRLQEIATELYLSTGKKRARQWELALGHLEKLNVPAAKRERLVKDDKPEQLARLVQDMLSEQK